MRLVRSGRAYRVNGPPHNRPVTEELASELERVLERFAREAGFSERDPVQVTLGAGVVGHHRTGRAVDIYEIGGVGLHLWHAQWRRCIEEALCVEPSLRKKIINRQCRANLGWRLYKALQRYGRWARPCAYPIQLFGPWTRAEGPWKTISNRLLAAHFDHIHLAK
jgi:hypothetical protein